MKISDYVKTDVATSFARSSPIVIAALTMIMLIPVCSSIDFALDSGSIEYKSLGEYILLIFTGAPPFDISSDSRYFQFPIMWIMECTVFLFVNVNYTDNIYSAFGCQLAVRSKSRKTLWRIKFISLVLSCIIQLAVFYLTVVIMAAVNGAQLTPNISVDFADMFFYDNDRETLAALTGRDLSAIMLVPAFSLLTCNIVQSVLRLYMKAAISFFTSMCILLASLYFFTPLLIGNFAMFSRIAPLLSNGLTLRQALISNGTIIVVSYVVGSARMSKMDFI